LSKNTRWALALVGIVILIVAAVVIGSGSDSNTAIETDEPSTPVTGSTDETKPSDPTGGTGGGGAGDDGSDTGGASPGDSGSQDGGDGTGGASPDDGESDSGGAPVGTTRATAPLLRAGAVKTIKVKSGDTVYLRARSSVPEELHIHGYDLYVDVPAGKTVSYKFKADIDGVFEIEQHGNGEQVAVLKVTP